MLWEGIEMNVCWDNCNCCVICSFVCCMVMIFIGCVVVVSCIVGFDY